MVTGVKANSQNQYFIAKPGTAGSGNPGFQDMISVPNGQILTATADASGILTVDVSVSTTYTGNAWLWLYLQAPLGTPSVCSGTCVFAPLLIEPQSYFITTTIGSSTIVGGNVCPLLVEGIVGSTTTGAPYSYYFNHGTPMTIALYNPTGNTLPPQITSATIYELEDGPIGQGTVINQFSGPLNFAYQSANLLGTTWYADAGVIPPPHYAVFQAKCNDGTLTPAVGPVWFIQPQYTLTIDTPNLVTPIYLGETISWTAHGIPPGWQVKVSASGYDGSRLCGLGNPSFAYADSTGVAQGSFVTSAPQCSGGLNYNQALITGGYWQCSYYPSGALFGCSDTFTYYFGPLISPGIPGRLYPYTGSSTPPLNAVTATQTTTSTSSVQTSTQTSTVTSTSSTTSSLTTTFTSNGQSQTSTYTTTSMNAVTSTIVNTTTTPIASVQPLSMSVIGVIIQSILGLGSIVGGVFTVIRWR